MVGVRPPKSPRVASDERRDFDAALVWFKSGTRVQIALTVAVTALLAALVAVFVYFRDSIFGGRAPGPVATETATAAPASTPDPAPKETVAARAAEEGSSLVVAVVVLSVLLLIAVVLLILRYMRASSETHILGMYDEVARLRGMLGGLVMETDSFRGGSAADKRWRATTGLVQRRLERVQQAIEAGLAKYQERYSEERTEHLRALGEAKASASGVE